ncbi:hypothetical protein [Bradyrhizobium sp. LM6.9]
MDSVCNEFDRSRLASGHCGRLGWLAGGDELDCPEDAVSVGQRHSMNLAEGLGQVFGQDVGVMGVNKLALPYGVISFRKYPIGIRGSGRPNDHRGGAIVELRVNFRPGTAGSAATPCPTRR